MQQVAIDLFDANGQKWLVLADRYSGYAWLKQLSKTASEHIIDTLTAWFETFCKNNNINHELASAHSPESNRLAEAAVKNMKSLVIRTAEEK